MTNDLNQYNELHIGDIVGDTKRIVIACTKLGERIPGDSYARWITICFKEDVRHPYVVWDVIAKSEGFSAHHGEYAETLEQAVVIYKSRGGLSES